MTEDNTIQNTNKICSVNTSAVCARQCCVKRDQNIASCPTNSAEQQFVAILLVAGSLAFLSTGGRGGGWLSSHQYACPEMMSVARWVNLCQY